MYYVGVDIAKDKHYVCILDESKELACKPSYNTFINQIVKIRLKFYETHSSHKS
jgi:type IV secretory pathway VirB4 component